MVQSENPVKMLWHEQMIIMFLRMMEGMIAVQSFFYYNNLQNQAQLASYRMIYLQFLKGHSHEVFFKRTLSGEFFNRTLSGEFFKRTLSREFFNRTLSREFFNRTLSREFFMYVRTWFVFCNKNEN